MAKRKSRRRKYDTTFVAIPFQVQLSLGTLADNTVLGANLVANLVQDIYIMSVKGSFSMKAHTSAEGPIAIGLANSDYTPAEVLEYLDVSLTGPNEKIANEQAAREIRKVGIFNGLSSDESLFDGRERKIKIMKRVSVGNTWNIYACNRSGAALTTGSIIVFTGTIFGKWLY